MKIDNKMPTKAPHTLILTPKLFRFKLFKKVGPMWSHSAASSVICKFINLKILMRICLLDCKNTQFIFRTFAVISAKPYFVSILIQQEEKWVERQNNGKIPKGTKKCQKIPKDTKRYFIFSLEKSDKLKTIEKIIR